MMEQEAAERFEAFVDVDERLKSLSKQLVPQVRERDEAGELDDDVDAPKKADVDADAVHGVDMSELRECESPFLNFHYPLYFPGA